MDINKNLKLDKEQIERLSFIVKILKNLKDKPLVLKGGTALMLYYNLDRFSEDIDFDRKK